MTRQPRVTCPDARLPQRRTSSARWGRSALSLGMLAVVLGGCGSGPAGSPNNQFPSEVAARLPVTALVYPGAVLAERHGSEPYCRREVFGPPTPEGSTMHYTYTLPSEVETGRAMKWYVDHVHALGYAMQYTAGIGKPPLGQGYLYDDQRTIRVEVDADRVQASTVELDVTSYTDRPGCA